MNQQGDVSLFHTSDGGEICVDNGLVEMSGGLGPAVYLSLFGGNEQDNGLERSKQTWWANLAENDKSRQYRSETQNLLKSIPATTGNLRRIEDAAIRDLKWLLDTKTASEVRVFASMPALNSVQVYVQVEAIGGEFNFEYTENWKAAS